MELTGRSIIGFQQGAANGDTLQAVNPATGEQLGPEYHSASDGEVNGAAELAAAAFEVYGRVSGKEKARFLRRIAENIEALGDPLVERATQETGLAAGRIQMEIGRTANQLRLFADLVEEGSWVNARIDRADPDRRPLPKPDVRSMMRPVGPVAVFCASNFPLAFSVAGGDTASALAAGNPVIVNAHHAHPGTAEMVGAAVRDAVRDCGLPEGVFSLVYGAGFGVGQLLVKHPMVKAVGFTGSRAGGRALMDLAAARPEPIPVFAEMSSTNPVFILPGAMRDRRDQIAAGLQGSVTLGAGQFCTNPGVVVISDDTDAAPFIQEVGRLIGESPGATMLTHRIWSVYRQAVEGRLAKEGVRAVPAAQAELAGGHCLAVPSAMVADADVYLSDPELHEEVFGPTTLVVTHSNREQLLRIARSIEGQLTATIHGTDQDLVEYADLVAALETRVGRLLFNGFPTGVEVCPAMVHGGPYPATSDGRSTSVGTRAIYRFARPVCYQGFPEAALPDELKDANPLGILRQMDGRMAGPET